MPGHHERSKMFHYSKMFIGTREKIIGQENL